MAKSLDDLNAVRLLVNALEGFEKPDQERIIRWAMEKLGNVEALSTLPKPIVRDRPPGLSGIPPARKESGSKDIKAFVNEKKPTSDNQFAATVAYYFRFEAPEDQRKDFIIPEDLQDACRKAGRERLKNPSQTLVHAHNAGLLDKVQRGNYSINSVGENLVAMTLPGENIGVQKTKRKLKQKPKANKMIRKVGTKKKKAKSAHS